MCIPFEAIIAEIKYQLDVGRRERGRMSLMAQSQSAPAAGAELASGEPILNENLTVRRRTNRKTAQ